MATRKETPPVAQRLQPMEVEMPPSSSSDEEDLPDDEGAIVDGIYIPPAQASSLSMDLTGPRLIITRITNNFFKSYANKEVLGPFSKCFNAIVGPNGSGKSNVIDSLLFVFGYRASKIRSKKVSVLIHNSRNYQNVTSCTVTVHFALIIDKDGDNYDVVPGSEFTVSRTGLKDNSSYYELNGRRVQFKEISVLLEKHGIDLKHNRFLILQGEVEQIAMMKCKGEKDGESGLLEYLEDIIGTTRYKKPLAEVFDRVEMLSERRSEKLNRVKMVEEELNHLRQPMQSAVDFLKKENTVIRSKNFLYQKAIKEVTGKSNEIQTSKDELFVVQKEFTDKLKALNDRKQQHLEAQNEEGKEYEQLNKKKESLTAAFNNANKKDVQLQENLVSKNKARKKAKEQIAEEKRKLSKLEKIPDENEQSIKNFEAHLKKLRTQKEQYEAEKAVILKNIQRETEPLQNQKEQLETDLTVLKENVTEARTAFDLAETELKMCLSNEESEKTKLAQLREHYETSARTIKERTEQVEELQRKIPGVKQELDKANQELLQARQEEHNLIDDVRVKRANLEEGRSSMQASSSRGRVLDSLMRAKHEGKCPGLFGRLGDLGAIDAKYDVAISTACGPLDNIVVDTVNCAQWCIEYLKQHNIGRGVFIALEKQEHLRERAESRIPTPENVHRLYDLVEVQDDRVKTAFYYALRDTLVANDLEQASRIAFGRQRFRVVTLKGDLIETSGTMSGGGKSVSRGRMGQSVAVAKVDPRELIRLEEVVVKMEQRVRELRQRQTSLTTQVAELQPVLREMQVNLEKFTSELKNLHTQQPNLQRQINEQTARVKSTVSDPAQVKQLTNVVEARKRKLDAAMETASELQVQVDHLTKEIKDRSTGKIRTVDKHIKECTKTIEKTQAEVTQLRVAVKTAERNYKSTTENIARMEQDVEEMEASLRAMMEQKNELTEDAKKLLECLEEVTAKLADREETFSKVRKEVAAIVKEETQLKMEKIDVDEKMSAFDKKLKEFKGVIRSYQAKIEQLKFQEIPDETFEELKKYTDEEIEETNVKAIEKELQAAESFLKATKPNLGAIQEYLAKQLVFKERAKELEEITEKRTRMRTLYDDLRKRRKEEFIAGYQIIKMKLKELYQMITLGGDADFEMIDSYDPFSEGIQFNVRPPRKTWKKISNLSGGEKTLSSLALVFALHYYKPSPLYIMDEIDAALDFKNVSIVGSYIKERTKNAQFIIISLRSNMFELCDNMVGIYKTSDITKSITLNPKLYESKPQTRPAQVQDAGENPENVRPSTEPNPTNSSEVAVNNEVQNEEQPADTEMEVDSIPETPSRSSSESEN